MSASLTLLFLCDRDRTSFPLDFGVFAAGFELLIEHSAETLKSNYRRRQVRLIAHCLP